MALEFTDTRIKDDGVAYGAEKFLVVNSLGELAALTGMVDGEVRLVPGYGFYRYDEDGVLSEDGIVVVGSATGQWINDTWYGIVTYG